MTNFIVHLVDDVERVFEILTEGYVPNFHKEDLSPSSDPKDELVYGIPMTSFADVALEDLYPLMVRPANYGRYGVIMSKDLALQ